MNANGAKFDAEEDVKRYAKLQPHHIEFLKKRAVGRRCAIQRTPPGPLHREPLCGRGGALSAGSMMPNNAALGCSRTRVYELINSETLSHLRMGGTSIRIPKVAIDRMIDAAKKPREIAPTTRKNGVRSRHVPPDDDRFPWETGSAPQRPWRCERCGFTCAWWCTAAAFRYCTTCAQKVAAAWRPDHADLTRLDKLARFSAAELRRQAQRPDGRGAWPDKPGDF